MGLNVTGSWSAREGVVSRDGMKPDNTGNPGHGATFPLVHSDKFREASCLPKVTQLIHSTGQAGIQSTAWPSCRDFLWSCRTAYRHVFTKRSSRHSGSLASGPSHLPSGSSPESTSATARGHFNVLLEPHSFYTQPRCPYSPYLKRFVTRTGYNGIDSRKKCHTSPQPGSKINNFFST